MKSLPVAEWVQPGVSCSAGWGGVGLPRPQASAAHRCRTADRLCMSSASISMGWARRNAESKRQTKLQALQGPSSVEEPIRGGRSRAVCPFPHFLLHSRGMPVSTAEDLFGQPFRTHKLLVVSILQSTELSFRSLLREECGEEEWGFPCASFLILSWSVSSTRPRRPEPRF